MYFQENNKYPLITEVRNIDDILSLQHIDMKIWNASFHYDEYIYKYEVSFIKSMQCNRVVYALKGQCICNNCQCIKN